MLEGSMCDPGSRQRGGNLAANQRLGLLLVAWPKSYGNIEVPNFESQ